jgi:pimeloyl-ACP methyl ester carboxylesterase
MTGDVEADSAEDAITRIMVGLVAVVLLVAAFFAIAYFGQRSVLFPVPWTDARPSRGTSEIVGLVLPAGTVEALFLPPTASVSGPAPLIIFTHGNAELAAEWVDQFTEPRSWGWAALLLEYPGYGGSAGVPSEPAILAAAEAALDWARHDPRVDSRRIVAYGRSLGGGPAARLASSHGLAGLILESVFTSVRPLAARYLVPGFLVRDPFDNLSALQTFRGPLLVLHGRADRIIPIAHGRALAAAVPGATFRELDCGHNDCPRPWTIIGEFLATHVDSSYPITHPK